MGTRHSQHRCRQQSSVVCCHLQLFRHITFAMALHQVLTSSRSSQPTVHTQPTVHPSVDTCTRPASLTCMHESMQPTAQAQQLSLSPRKPGYPHRPRAAACCDSAAPAAAQRSRGRNPRLCFRRCYHHLGGETAQQRASRGLPQRPVAGHTGDCGRTGREQHTPRSDARDSAASLLSPRRAKHARPLVCGFLFRVFYYSVSRIFIISSSSSFWE